MKIGAAGTVRPPVDRVGRDAERAERKGYASLLYADHMMGWFPEALWSEAYTPAAAVRRSAHDYLDPVCAVMDAAAATESLRLGFGVTDLLRTHPAVVARTALTLDHYCGGRFVLGLGAGEAENLVPYGLSMERAVSRLEEGLEIIRLLWDSDGPVSSEGAAWPLRDAVLGLEPREGATPPVWLAARGPRMRRIAARLADGWLPMFIGSDEYGASLQEINGLRAQHGRSGPFEAGYYSFVAIGESKDHCLSLFESPLFRCLGLLLPASAYAARGLEHPLGSDRYGLVDLVPTALDESTALRLIEGVPPEVVGDAILHGSPDDIVGDLRALANAGCEHAVLANVSFLTDPALAKPSYDALDEITAQVAGFSPSTSPAVG